MELSELKKRNQINGVNGIYKTIGMYQLNWNRRCITDLMVELRACKLWKRWFPSNQLKRWNQWN